MTNGAIDDVVEVGLEKPTSVLSNKEVLEEVVVGLGRTVSCYEMPWIRSSPTKRQRQSRT